MNDQRFDSKRTWERELHFLATAAVCLTEDLLRLTITIKAVPAWTFNGYASPFSLFMNAGLTANTATERKDEMNADTSSNISVRDT